MKTVVCPGSFDPVTNGHMDIIRRASGLFDRVVVLVAANQEKRNHFTPVERKAMIEKVLAQDPSMSNVVVDLFDGLLVDYIAACGASAIVKGLRAVSDFEYEFQMAMTNHKLLPQCETIFFTPSPQNMYLSSSIVRQVGGLGGDISSFVPSCIHDEIRAKLLEEHQNMSR
ncbi:pantetheine-phosphate adenylyltransferase [Angelakisella massiliensis]|uniref:pantetheine-phosphate adenylyltransferase n=1 Tax=Angelakisella massiliensis TaxID=1871018 RepID=UPI0008F85571|nr:pantetheine-phosphate adenylyltransferase [Angelakisella massiliensis]